MTTVRRPRRAMDAFNSRVTRRVRAERKSAHEYIPGTRPRRVLVAHPSPDLYGSDRQLLESVGALVSDGWLVDVVLPHDGPLRPLIANRGARVEVHDFPVLRKALLRPAALVKLIFRAPAAVLRLRSRVRALDADLVYVNTVTIPFWMPAARLARIPVVCHVHEAETALPRPVRVLLTAPLLLAQHAVANSISTRHALVGALPMLTSRITVIHNGVPDEGTPAPLRMRQPSDPLRLALVSRLSPRKGIDVALSAVASLRATGRDVTLDICGSPFTGYEWYEEELRSRAARQDLAGAVTFHGYVHPTRPVLDAADIVLVPSFGESFGNAAVEGLLAARPVVASDVQALAEVIHHGQTGLLATPGSPDQLADAITTLADAPERAGAMAAAGRAAALRQFSVERYSRELTRLLRGVSYRASHETSPYHVGSARAR